MSWQPIETAPKDGTVFIALLHPTIREQSGYVMELVRYENRPLLGNTWTAQNHGFSTELTGATYWQPLPSYATKP